MGKRIALFLLASVAPMILWGAPHLTLNLNGAGNLKELLLESDIDGLESLKVTGKMKAPDWEYLASNSGIISYVKDLDLSEAEISYDGEVYGFYSESAGSMGVMNMEEYRFWPRDSVATRQILEGVVYEYWGNNLAGEFRGTKYEKIVLPKTIAGIGRYAFRECGNLREVVMCGNEKYIGDAAFYKSGALSKLELPASVESIGASAFYEAGNGLALDMTNVRKIGDRAFMGSGICDVILPETIDELPVDCFSGCMQLHSVKTGPRLKAIGESAFSGCKNLQSVTFSEGLEKIGNWAFYWCESLRECALPESIKVISDEAFSVCKNLETINIPDGVEEMGMDAFINTPFEKTLQSDNGIVYIGHIAYCPAQDMPADVEIKEGTRVLANGFFGLRFLNGDHATERLKSVKLPSTLTHIGSLAFGDCKLNNITLPEGLVKIGTGCFENVELESITLPSSLKIIGDKAFYLTSLNFEAKIREIEFPTGLEEIGVSAFERHPLKSVTLPEGLKVLGAGAFSDNPNLVSINYNCRDAICPDMFREGSGAPFWGSSCDRLTFGDNVESIPSCLFESLNLSVTSLAIPDGVKKIGDKAFYQCSSVKTVSIPPMLESIGEYAFYNTGIENLTLPESVRFIGDNAFGMIDCLKTVDYNCRHAESSDKTVTTQYGPERRLGVPFADSTCEVLNIGENVRYIMPHFMTGKKITTKTLDLSKIEQIGEYAFAYSAFESLILPEKLDEIPDYAFNGCKTLSSVKMPVSCKRIGEGAFGGCYLLNPCRLVPEDVEEIGIRAFYRCRGADFDAERNRWESLVLPSSLQRVEEGAFQGCSGVNTVFIPSTIEYIGKSSLAFAEEYGTSKKVIMMRDIPLSDAPTPFDENDSKQTKWTAVVPKGSKSLYTSQPGWSTLNIEEMDELTVDAENEFDVNFDDLRASGGGADGEVLTAEGTVIGGVYYSLPSFQVNNDLNESNAYLTFWDGCSADDAAKLHSARIDTDYIYDFFTGFGVMLPAVKGCIELDADLNGRTMNVLLDGHDVVSSTNDDRTKQYVDFDLSEPTYAWFYLSPDESRPGADIYRLAVHPNQNAGGIDAVDPDKATVVVRSYDINGRTVPENYQGVIIERLSDGSVRKVIR